MLPWQRAQIVQKIMNYCPDELGMPFFLWTRESVATLIFKIFRIRYSKWTIGRYLSDWGFTPQKPVRKAIEQNPIAVKKWLEVDYPKIRKRAHNEQATIYWGDEMGLRSDHNAGKTYGVKGKTPVIARTGKRFSCNMISAITNLGSLSFMIYHENFTDDVFLKFLKKLIHKSTRKVFLIVDRHRSHRSKKVNAWLELHVNRIQLEFLPPYCPELNPDEFLNQDVKSSMGKKRPQNIAEMKKNLRNHLKTRQKQPNIIQKFVRGCHTQYSV
jgi:transposase